MPEWNNFTYFTNANSYIQNLYISHIFKLSSHYICDLGQMNLQKGYVFVYAHDDELYMKTWMHLYERLFNSKKLQPTNIYLEINLTEKHQHERKQKTWNKQQYMNIRKATQKNMLIIIVACVAYELRCCTMTKRFAWAQMNFLAHMHLRLVRALRKTHQKSFAYAISHALRCLCIKYMYIL